MIAFVCVIIFSSCSKKKPEESAVPQHSSSFQPPTEIPFDSSGAYISPTDLFRDNSEFNAALFQPTQAQYFGNHILNYAVTVHALKSGRDSITLVVEYLHAKVEYTADDGRKTIEESRTVTRLLFYLNNTLSFRKAFPVEMYDSSFFSSTRSFDKTFFDAGPTKVIVYYWMDETGYGEHYEKTNRREYQAVGVDKEGIIYDLVGYFHHVSDNLNAVRFLSEDRVSASIIPNLRYRNLTIDVVITIDWKTSTTSLEIPEDSIFTVTNMPNRYFGSKIRLFAEPSGAVVFKELPLRRSTLAQMQKIFLPSLFNAENIVRDRLFVQFTNANKGWIDYTTMVFEEIISEK